MVKRRVEALIVIQTTLFDTAPYRVVRLAATHRIPAMYGLRVQAEAGGLMSYGPSVGDMYGQAAAYVDKILGGAKPGDLPIEQPTRVGLLINLRTAGELGLEIPQSLLLRADQIIRQHSYPRRPKAAARFLEGSPHEEPRRDIVDRTFGHAHCGRMRGFH